MGFGDDNVKISAFTFAGLAMMLNIRLVYSAAPYALLRFKLPENLFSVFVRVMAGSLELWCLPSMTIANIMDYFRAINVKEWYDWEYHWQSIFWSWANFVTFVILWISFIIGGEQGNVTAFYWVIAASGFVFGINMVMVYAMEFQYLPWYMIGENSFPMVTSLMHYVGTLFFGNRRKWNSDYIIVTIDIVISLAISLVAAILWTIAYWKGKAAKDGWPPSDPNQRDCKTLSVSGSATEMTYSLGTNFADSHATKPGECGFKKSPAYYLHFIPPSLMVLIGMGLVYCIYPGIAPGMIVPFYLIDKIEMVLLIATAFPPVIIGIMKNYNINPYIPMGNWGTYHQKSCKGGSEPGRGGGTTEKCGCNDSPSGASVSGNATLRVHNTTITNDGGLEAIATIKATNNSSSRDHTGEINTITNGALSKAGGDKLQTTTQLHVGEILNLTGSGKGAIAAGEITIEGTIIVTNPGTLGNGITLKGRLDGKLNLSNDDASGNNTINLTQEDGTLTAKAPSALALHGITVNGSSGLTGTATMEITSNDHDLTKITNEVTITVTKLTKADDKPLTTATTLTTGDTLNLEGRATAGDIKNLTVTGTITIGTGGTLGTTIGFTGDVTGSLTLADAPDGVTVTGGGTLTLIGDKLTALQNTNFSLTSRTNRALTYGLVTKNTIIIGPNTSNPGKVVLSGLPLIPACININNASGFSATITDVTFSKTGADTSLKDHGGLDINLTTGLKNSTVTITKGTVKSLTDGKQLDTNTNLVPDDTLTLNITPSAGGTNTTLSGKINVTKSGNLSGTLTLSGGIRASNITLSDSGNNGTLTADGVSISTVKYDHYALHVNHKSTHCCFWGGKVWKWSNSNPKNVPWHIPVVLGPFQICLAAVLIYSLHYRDSSLSRSIVNQPKMSTALSIVFYMCHEIQLALGFPGIASDPNILLPMQLVGAFLMVLLAFYSVGYITEYKRHDPSQWPTEGMTKWNALCYWLKMASKITNKNFKQLFTTDLRRDLLL